MTNIDVAKLLRNIAAAYMIINERKYRFQIIAYQKASDAIEGLTTGLEYLIREGQVDKIPGVGDNINIYLKELIETGHVKHFDSVLQAVPASVFPLLEVPGFGPKKSHKLVTAFNLNDPNKVINKIEMLAREGKIADIEGFGSKSQQDILVSITNFKKGQTKSVRMNLPYATNLAEKMLDYLNLSEAVIKAIPLGSLRRRRDTIGDIDIAVSTHKPEAVIQHFINYPYLERIIERGDSAAGITVSGGKHIDLMTIKPDAFGSLLQHFTGSKEHNIHLRELALAKKLSLSEYGIKNLNSGRTNEYQTEEQFYAALGLQWIPPEIRENTGEIELAASEKLPELVKHTDIKGDFHLHSDYPIEPSHDMGQNSMEEMVNKAISLGYSYLGFAEHNPSISNHSSVKISSLLKRRLEFISNLRLKYNNIIRIYSLLEVDILPDGTLAVNDIDTQYLDFMLVSIHSVFNMNIQQMTNRVIGGLSHPKAKIFTHPTGRLINKRPGYELDWNKIFNFCRTNYKALEINAYPDRLDLTDSLVRKAVNEDVMLCINTDSHAVEQMGLMRYGIDVARRGWASKLNILNTKEYNELEKWIRR